MFAFASVKIDNNWMNFYRPNLILEHHYLIWDIANRIYATIPKDAECLSLSRTDTLSFPSRLHVFTNNPRGRLLESWRYDLIAKYVFSVLAAERTGDERHKH